MKSEFNVNGTQISGPVKGVLGMQPHQPAGPHDGQRQQQDPNHVRRMHLNNTITVGAERGDMFSLDDGIPRGELRGRDRSRDGPGNDISDDEEMSAAGPSGGNAETSTARKRRRSRKGLDKKFECPHPGCGKSYSRAEHLYRHQLNRKQPLILSVSEAS
jgi:hypothetical protein